MKVYISGQISGLNEIECKETFDSIQWDYFWKKGVLCINPFDLKPFLGVKCWLCYMCTDLYHLRKCTHCAMQSNWIQSRGACIEHYFAKFIFKLEVIYL
jgi:hypothetical protein